MPPVAPSVLTIAQTIPRAPIANISWTHGAAATVDRWVVYFQRPQDVSRSLYGVFAKADLVSGGGYAIDVPSPVDTEWTVGAMDTAGAISPVRLVTFSESASGVWLFPFKSAALQTGLVVGLSGDLIRGRPISSTSYLPPFDEAQIVSIGKVHSADGRVEGIFRKLDVGAETLTREQVEDRLDRLLVEQQIYRIALATAKRFYRSIAITERVEYNETSGDDVKSAAFPFVQVP
jgi:hypothetical protein